MMSCNACATIACSALAVGVIGLAPAPLRANLPHHINSMKFLECLKLTSGLSLGPMMSCNAWATIACSALAAGVIGLVPPPLRGAFSTVFSIAVDAVRNMMKHEQ